MSQADDIIEAVRKFDLAMSKINRNNGQTIHTIEIDEYTWKSMVYELQPLFVQHNQFNVALKYDIREIQIFGIKITPHERKWIKEIEPQVPDHPLRCTKCGLSASRCECE